MRLLSQIQFVVDLLESPSRMMLYTRDDHMAAKALASDIRESLRTEARTLRELILNHAGISPDTRAGLVSELAAYDLDTLRVLE